MIGRVNNYMYDSISPLPFATVTNRNSGNTVKADQYGYYRIKAQLRDTIIFSNTNFISDTVKVEEQFFISGYDASLIKKTLFLSNVTVRANYSLDSLARRNEYQKIYEKSVGITGGNTPVAGAGIVFSPMSFFSKDAMQKRRLKKRLIRDERDYYIDYLFSVGRVSTLTGLKEDALHAFMIQYRPSYKLARSLGYNGITMYINNKYKEYQQAGQPILPK